MSSLVKIEDPNFLRFLQTKKFRSALCNAAGISNNQGPYINPKAVSVLNKTSMTVRQPIDDDASIVTMEGEMLTEMGSHAMNQIRSIDGIEVFVNLVTLNCSRIGLNSLNKLPTKLVVLNASGNNLKEMSQWPATLEKLDIGFNKSIVLTALPEGLLELKCADCELTELPKLPSSLKILDCRDNQLPEIVGLPEGLEELNCASNLLSEKPEHPQAKIDYSDNKIKKIKKVKDKSMFGGSEDDNFYIKLAIVNELIKSDADLLKTLENLVEDSDIRFDMMVFGLVHSLERFIYTLNITKAQLESIESLRFSRNNEILYLLDPDMEEDVDDYDVTTFDGLEELENLSIIYLEDAVDEDIYWVPLRKLKSLKQLYCSLALLSSLKEDEACFADLKAYISLD
jgi:Leucine-rich repeat (LRR) protein